MYNAAVSDAVSFSSAWLPFLYDAAVLLAILCRTGHSIQYKGAVRTTLEVGASESLFHFFLNIRCCDSQAGLLYYRCALHFLLFISLVCLQPIF